MSRMAQWVVTHFGAPTLRLLAGIRQYKNLDDSLALPCQGLFGIFVQCDTPAERV